MPRGAKKTSKKKPRARKPRKAAAKAKQSKVKYAKVPKQFEPIFARAQDFVSKYFDDLKGDARHGTIEASGERYLLVRTASMSVDFFETIRGLYKGAGEKEAFDVARNLLFDIAHSIGKADAKSFHKKMKLDDPVEKLSAGPIHFAYSGWAFVDIFPESKPTPDENYYLIYDHPYSFESAAWLKAKKKSDCPVCTMNAGYSSGWCEESFGITLVAKEIMCKAAGDKACRFIMAPPSKIEAHIQKYLKKKPSLLKKIGAYEVPGFFKRKEIEQGLRASEKAFRLVFENTTDAIFWADIKSGIIIKCNEAAEKLVGKERSEIIGQHQTTLHPSDKASYYADHFRKAIREGDRYLEEVEVISSSGAIKLVEVSVSLTEIDSQQVIQGIFRDVTDRKRAERDLRQEKDFTEKVIESLTHPFYVVNASDYTIEMANKAAGFGELTAAPKCYELTHRRKTPCGDKEGCPLEIVKKTKKPAVLEHQHYDEKGILHYYEVHGYPIFDQENNVVQMIEYTLDITERKKAEDALRTSEKKYRDLLENIPCMVYQGKKDWSVSMVGPFVEELTGYSAEEFEQRRVDWLDLIHPEDRERVVEEALRVVSGGAHIEQEYRIKRRDGEERWVRDNKRAIVENGEFVGVDGFVVDVTDRRLREEESRQAAEELRESKIFTENTLNTVTDIFYAFDLNGKFLFRNKALSKVSGYSDKELATMKAADFFLGENSKDISEGIERVFNEGTATQEALFNLKNGDQIPYEFTGSVLKDGKGNVVGFCGVGRDITERKHMEEELRAARNNMEQRVELRTAELKRSQQLYQTLAETAEDYIFIIGPDMMVRYVNEFGARALKSSKDKIIGKKLTELFPFEASVPMREAIERVFSSGAAVSAENPLKFPDSEIWLHTHLVPLKDERGKVTGVMGLSRDVTVRRGYEERLRLTQTTMDRVGSAIFWMGPDANFVYVNDEACKSLGYSREELLTMSVHDIDPNFPREVWDDHWRDLKERGSFTMESSQLRKDGSVIPTEINVNYLEYGGREFNCAIVLDTTERKKAEEALKASELRFKQLFENMGNGVAIYSPTDDGTDFIIKDMNRAGYEITNRKPGEVLGKRLSEVFKGVDAMGLPSVLRGVDQSGEPQRFPSTLYEDQRLKSWFENYIYKLPQGDVVAIFSDVTAQRKAEDALKQSEKRYRGMFENSPVSLWEEDYSGVKNYIDELIASGITDVGKHFLESPQCARDTRDKVRVLDVNQASVDLFGAKTKDELLRNRDKISNVRSLPMIAGIISAIAAGKTFYHGEGSGSKLTGETLELSMSFAVMPGEEETYSKVLISIADITQRKEAEEELKRAIKLKSDFMAMMSHELRTPLTRIIASTHLVLRDRDAVLPDNRVNNLNNVLSSSDTLLLMINNVLEMARLEGGAIPVSKQECDLRHMIRTSISGCEGMMGEKGLKIITNIDDAAATIYTDKEKLGHIIMNLISNSVRYSDRGTIEITAKPSKIQGCVDIAVSDEGIGIPSEKMSQLFEPFKQLEELAYRRPGGIGLGLAIVKANLDLIGGSIDVKSEVGKGSTFTVTIPKEPSKEEYEG